MELQGWRMNWMKKFQLMKVRDVKRWLQNLPIKLRLLYSYLFTFLLLLFIGNTLFYFYFRANLTEKIETELNSSAVFIQNMVRATAKSSAINHLRAIAENNLDITIGIYHQKISENEAKKRAAEVLTSQTIGKTGFLYSVNSRGIIQAHPDKNLLGQNLSTRVEKHPQTGKKHGYLEYEWTVKGDKKPFKKSSYLSYFGPWDWIISATVNTNEIKDLIDINDLEKAIRVREFGASGYAFVLDVQGNLIFHPDLSGKNIFHVEDSDGRKFIQEICEKKNGRIFYPWQNPGENKVREKLAYYRYIPEFNWIIATTGYLDELYAPLKTLRYLLLSSFIFITLLVFLLTWQISDTITKPIKYLTSGLKRVSNGDFSTRLSPKSTDELGRLESYFNTFISQLEESNTKLNQSEKSFRSIFENAVEGIFQFDLVGNILKVNPSFVAMLGYDSSQALLEEGVNLQRDFIVKKELWNTLLELIISDRAVKGLELQLYRKSGTVFWCLLNARAIYEEGSDKIAIIEGFLSDIHDKKVAQESQEKLMLDLEKMVDERTVELSTRISELERRDLLNRYMGEMGDMLQSCRTTEETYPVINQYLKMFFPEDLCSLYINDSNKQMIERVVPPPSDSVPFMSMTNDSCWALRQGKNYLFNTAMDSDITCDHVEEAPHGYICIPLIAQGVTIGLLHIIFQNSSNLSAEETATILDRKSRLCSRLAEHLSLALANLNLQEKLKLKSIQDSLTGLANRRHMEEILQRQFYRMLRYNTPCSLIMLDVDHFKKFNDTYGHDMGDFVLKELGGYLKKNSRGEDLACRYGGEEFIIILVDTDIDQARKKAERLREDIAQVISIPYLSDKLHVTVSIGVATCPQHGQNSAELLKAADTALYQAKKNGRNRVEVALVEAQ